MPWLSLPAYARSTGTPESTVRALIRAGKLRAELEQREPGSSRVVWRIWQDDPPGPPVTPSRPESDPPQIHPQAMLRPSSGQEVDHPPTATTDPSAAITAALAPLLEIVADQSEAIGEERRMVAELHERIAALREQLGRTETERDTLRAELTRAQRPWWRRLLS